MGEAFFVVELSTLAIDLYWRLNIYFLVITLDL